MIVSSCVRGSFDGSVVRHVLGRSTLCLQLIVFVLLLSGCSSDGKNTDPDAGDTDTDTGTLECSDEDDFDESQCPDTYPSSSCVAYVDGDVASSGDGWSWGGAVKTVQEGIDLAHCGATIHGECDQWEVWVKAGTYYIHEGCREHTVRLRDHVALLGGFDGTETSNSDRDWETNVTTLDGRDGPDGENHVYHVVLGADDSVLDGLTVTEGRADHETEQNHQWGGGLKISEDVMNVVNCRFIENQALVMGGGIDSMAASLTVTDCRFEENAAGNGGGVNHWSSSATELKVEDCSFVGNIADVHGGGICAGLGSDEITIEGSLFEGNVAGYSGGGLEISDSTVSFSECAFVGNRITGEGSGDGYSFGGACTIFECEAASFTDCSFEDNESSYAGGALVVQSSSCSVTSCEFENNTAVEYGGGMTSLINDSFEVLNGSFVGNSSMSGGGIYFQQTNVEIVASTFEQNSAARLGGAVSVSDSDVDISDSEFISNITTDEGDEETADIAGGGMLVMNSVAEVNGCLFEDNESLNGGGYFSYGSEEVISDCQFVTNSAQIDGGGYFANGLLTALFEGCLFESNISSRWGGGMIVVGDMSVLGCSFEGNESSMGAGMFNIEGEVEVEGCTFTGNSIVSQSEEYPGTEAAAILNLGTVSTISNCTFWGNTSFDNGVGATIVPWSDPVDDQYDYTTIINSIIWDNEIPALTAIDSSPTVTFSDIEGGYPGTGNIDEDPMFVDPDAGDFCLQAGSPCIGAGDGGVDMGAPCSY